jgi:exopolysaccharide biosynthesis polyprenyl glycosylphosphotransferase
MVSIKKVLILLGDVLIFYGALLATLSVRYGFDGYLANLNEHLLPFSILIVVWLAVFQIAGLYELRNLKNDIQFFRALSAAVGINVLLAIALFYLFPFGIAPKTNLFIFAVLAVILGYLWRLIFNSLSVKTARQPVLLIGDSNTADELAEYLDANPQLGCLVSRRRSIKEAEGWEDGILVVPRSVKDDATDVKSVYRRIIKGVQVMDIVNFYEHIFNRTPLKELGENWFIDIIARKRKTYEIIKTTIETVLALLAFIVLSPLFLLLIVLIRASSAGPAVYKQTRSGKNNAVFTLYKFRTMRNDAEKSGPQWAKTKDPRVTAVGRFLRAAHLDELPQLVNILKGDLSFVGPRPERPEFTELLSRDIPYYEVRNLVRPGLTGWAQINYRYTSSVEDTFKKLEYDIFYIKNRSVIMDLIIMLKTAKTLLTTPK